MRWIVIAMLFATSMSGCIIEGDLNGTGQNCPTSEPLRGGFLVKVPSSVGEGGNRVATAGWCVVGLKTGADSDLFVKMGTDQMAWLPIEGEGTYNIHMSIPEPEDRFCAFYLEAAEATHSGTGIMEVTLRHDGVSICS
jgi:hypothetical protein